MTEIKPGTAQLLSMWRDMRKAIRESPNELAEAAFAHSPSAIRALSDEALKLFGMSAMFGFIASDSPLPALESENARLRAALEGFIVAYERSQSWPGVEQVASARAALEAK